MDKAKDLVRIFLQSDQKEDIKEAVLSVASRPEYNCKQEVEELINLKTDKQNGNHSKNYPNNF